MVAVDGTGALVGTYYLRPNSLALGAHVANAGYVVAEHCRRQGIGSRLCQHSLQATRPSTAGSATASRWWARCRGRSATGSWATWMPW
jgi:GNAT superfamily N-acetyltransferase